MESNWKVDYIRMWQNYYDKPMSTRQVDEIMNNDHRYYVDAHLKSYKLGRLLEALGKLKHPN